MGAHASKCCETKKDDDVTIDLTKSHTAYDEPQEDEVTQVPSDSSDHKSSNDNGVFFEGGDDTKGEEEQKEAPKEVIVAPTDEETAVAPEAEVEEKPPPENFQDRTFEELKEKVGDKIKQVLGSVPRRPSSDGTSLQEYVTKHESDTWTSLKAMELMDGWSLKKEEDGIKIYMKQEKGSALMSFKAITEIECDPDKFPLIISELLEVEKRPRWDKMCSEARTLESYAPFYRVSYVKMLSPADGIFAPRDLCNLSRLRFEEDGGVMMSLQNVVHKDAPVAPGHVRAEMSIGGYIFRPLEGKKGVRMVYCGTVDPKGWLPTWVANLVAWKQGLGLVQFKNSLYDAGILSK